MSFVNKPLTDILDCVRASTATYVDATGRIRTAGVNQPRIDFSSGQGRLLVEETRTNLITWSEDFSDASWSKVTNFVWESTNIPSPINNVNYMRIKENSANGFRQISQDVTINSNQPFSLSFFVKKDVGERFIGVRISNTSWSNRASGVFSPQTGEFTDRTSLGLATFIGSKSEKQSDGSYRISISGIPDTSGVTTVRVTLTLTPFDSSSLPNYQGDGVSSLLVTGPQLEQASTPSSYIPTQASAVTRAADSMSRVLGDEFNPNEFSVYLDFISKAETSQTVYFFDVGRLNNTVNNILLWKPAGLGIRLQYFADTTQGTSSSNITTPQRVKAVIVFNKANKTAQLFTNGVANSVINITTLALDPTTFRFPYAGSNYNSEIEKVVIYPKALTSSEAIELTRI